MSDEQEKKTRGTIVLDWWRQNIAARDNSAARGLSARLRRSEPLSVLMEPAVHELARSIGLKEKDASTLVRLVCLLAELRETDAVPLAARLGGTEPVLSPARFEKLMRADDDDLMPLLRRAILMADRRCNVSSFADDMLNWTPATRNKWCFQYF